MVSKELKNLSRHELLDIIYQMKKNEKQMEEEISALQEALREKRIRNSVAGSIAEAAVSITNVFSAAQMTADLYLQEIARMKEETEQECAKRIAEADEEAARILAEGEEKYEALRLRYRAKYKKWQQLLDEIEAAEEKLGRD